MMKNIFSLIFLLVSFISFAQQKKTVASGYITFNSGSNFEFKNMVLDGDTVTYFNEITQSPMNFKLNAVKKIVDNTGATIYEAGKSSLQKEIVPAIAEKTVIQHDTLVFKSATNIMLNGKTLSDKEAEQLFKQNNDAYALYIKGRKNATTGNIFIGGGIGFAAGWTLGALAGNGNLNGAGPGIALGLVSTIIGIPIKLSGSKQLKLAVWKYNHDNGLVSYLDNAELKFTAGPGTVGFQVKF